jgi:hypothetical protein
MQWVSRITTMALMTVLPIVGGRWLDNRFATSYWGLVGLVVGLAVGFWQMMLLAKSAGAKGSAARKSRGTAGDAGGTESPAANAGRTAKRSSPANARSLTDETAEIAKRIDAALGKKSQSPENETPDREP